MPGDIGGRGVLQRTSVVEDEDPVGERDSFDGVVSDDQAYASEAVEMTAEGVPDLGAGGLVEGSERLVEQKEPGSCGQRPGEGDSLGAHA